MADINAQQIRKIYAIGNALGIVERGNEDDDLHALVSALTGKDSVKALTYTEAQAVIADLQKRQGAAPLPRHKPKTHPERPGGATDGQQRKVWALMYQLAKEDTRVRFNPCRQTSSRSALTTPPAPSTERIWTSAGVILSRSRRTTSPRRTSSGSRPRLTGSSTGSWIYCWK